MNRFYYPDISATSQVLTDLAKRLAALGHDVHVVCSRLRYEGGGAPLPPFERQDGVAVHRVWTTSFGRSPLSGRLLDYLSFYPSAIFRLARVARRGDVVVVKTDPPLLSVLVAPFVRLRGSTLVNWVQDVFPEVADHSRSRHLPRWLQAPLMALRDRSLRGANMNVVLGTTMRDYLRRRNVPESRLRIVENWAAGETVHAIPPAASELRRALGIGEEFVVGYSGNMGLAHDHETILGAAELLQADATTRFLIVGGGSGMRLLQAEVERRGLRNMQFLAYQPRDRLADSLAAADVHLVTLRPEAEGFVVPSKLYGVMAAARPVVFVGDVASEIARAVERAACGACVSCGDAQGLAAELLRLKSDERLRLRLGENAASAYRSNYTFEAASGRWLEVLRAVVP
jgi:glycosyltransferase involved in cell wall biosynthesis